MYRKYLKSTLAKKSLAGISNKNLPQTYKGGFKSEQREVGSKNL